MSGTLRIRRITTAYVVSREAMDLAANVHPTPAALRASLGDSIRALLARWLERDDSSVWLVRHLDIKVLAQVGATAGSLPDVIAAAFGRALAEALHGDGDGVNSIRFESSAAYLARFAIEAAYGDPWSHWYFESLKGLKALSASGAIRTALGDHPVRGFAALTMLDDFGLALVARTLAAHDEMRLLDSFAASAANDEPGDSARFDAAYSGLAHAQRLLNRRGVALFASVRAGRGAPSRALIRAVRILGDAAAAAADLDRAERGQIWRTLETRRTTSTPALPMPFAALRDVPMHIVGALLRDATGLPSDGGSAEVDTPTETKFDTERAIADALGRTKFGGALLLLRELEAWPWGTWTAAWRPPPAGNPTAALRLLVLAACCGKEQMRRAFDDVVLRRLLGVPGTFSLTECGVWLQSLDSQHATRFVVDEVDVDMNRRASPFPDTVVISPADAAWLSFPRAASIPRRWQPLLRTIAHRALRRFATRLPGFAESTIAHLWSNFLTFDANIDREDERVVVRCGRPPLHLLLTLTGMTRGTIAGTDSRGREILLFPRE